MVGEVVEVSHEEAEGEEEEEEEEEEEAEKMHRGWSHRRKLRKGWRGQGRPLGVVRAGGGGRGWPVVRPVGSWGVRWGGGRGVCELTRGGGGRKVAQDRGSGGGMAGGQR